MGRYDNATKLFFSDKNNFLSVIKLYFEKDVVHEHDDVTTGRLFSLAGYMDDLNRGEMKRATMYGRERDAVKRVKVGRQPMIIGIENQQNTDYSEPIRVMLYDSMEYDKQRQVIQNIHKEKGDLKKGEFMAGFSRKDLVVPVRTIVIYYGKEPWLYPMKLSDIWECTEDLDEDLMDYRINVLDVRRLTEEQIEGIESDVRLLFGCIKYDKEPEKMREFVEKNRKCFENLTKETFTVIAVMTNSKILQEKVNEWEKGGAYNMCKAFEEWRKEDRRIGYEEGRKEGILALIETYKELGGSRENAFDNLKKKFLLNDEECEKYVQMYW